VPQCVYVCVSVCWCASPILFDCFYPCVSVCASHVLVLVTFAGYANILRGTLPKDMDSLPRLPFHFTIALPLPLLHPPTLLILFLQIHTYIYFFVVFLTASFFSLLTAYLVIYLLFVVCKIYFLPSSKKRAKCQTCSTSPICI